MEYRPSPTHICKDFAVQGTSEACALVFPCTPSLFTSLLRGRWGTFLGSSSCSSTLGINPLQLCPLLPDCLSPASPCYLTPPVLSYPSWPFCTLNTFFTGYSQVTHAKQASSVTTQSPKDSHMVTHTHTLMQTQMYTRKTMHHMHPILCCLGKLESLVDKNTVSQTHKHTAANIYRKSPLAVPQSLCCEAGLRA